MSKRSHDTVSRESAPIDWEEKQALWNRVFTQGNPFKIRPLLLWLIGRATTDADIMARDTTLLIDLAALYDWIVAQSPAFFIHSVYDDLVLKLVQLADPETAHVPINFLCRKPRPENYAASVLRRLISHIIVSPQYWGVCREVILHEQCRRAAYGWGSDYYIQTLFALFKDPLHGHYYLQSFIEHGDLQLLVSRWIPGYTWGLHRIFVQQPLCSVARLSDAWPLTVAQWYGDHGRLRARPRVRMQNFLDYLFFRRIHEIAVSLHPFRLGALQTLAIVDALLPNSMSMHAKWRIICASKHFHERQ